MPGDALVSGPDGAKNDKAPKVGRPRKPRLTSLPQPADPSEPPELPRRALLATRQSGPAVGSIRPNPISGCSELERASRIRKPANSERSEPMTPA